MKKYLAEMVGTFVLVFGGCGSAVLAGEQIGFLGVSIAFGLTLLAMAYAIWHISGCHINPADYIVAQITGGILAAGLLLAIAKGVAGGYDPTLTGFAANGYGDHSPGHYNLISAFLAEVILTFFLMFTVLGVTDIKAPVGFAGIPIGLVLVLIHLIGIPVTNTSVNPARSIGPAVFVGGWALSQLWLFIIAPTIGAIIAAVVYRVIGTSRPIISTQEAERALDSEVEERRR
jgi:aquaporin Z